MSTEARSTGTVAEMTGTSFATAQQQSATAGATATMSETVATEVAASATSVVDMSATESSTAARSEQPITGTSSTAIEMQTPTVVELGLSTSSDASEIQGTSMISGSPLTGSKPSATTVIGTSAPMEGTSAISVALSTILHSVTPETGISEKHFTCIINSP